MTSMMNDLDCVSIKIEYGGIEDFTVFASV